MQLLDINDFFLRIDCQSLKLKQQNTNKQKKRFATILSTCCMNLYMCMFKILLYLRLVPKNICNCVLFSAHLYNVQLELLLCSWCCSRRHRHYLYQPTNVNLLRLHYIVHLVPTDTVYTFVPGGGFTSNRGTFGNVAKQCDMMCLAFGKSAEMCMSGGSDGNIFIWSGTTLQKVVKAHEGPVFAMHSLDKV